MRGERSRVGTGALTLLSPRRFRLTAFVWSFARNSRMRVEVTAVSGQSPKNGAAWIR